MVRYATYEEVNQAILELEEADCNLAASEKEKNSLHSNGTALVDGEVQVTSAGSVTGREMQNNGAVSHEARPSEADGAGLVDDGDTETETESGSMEGDGQEEEEDLEEDKYPDHDDEGMRCKKIDSLCIGLFKLTHQSATCISIGVETVLKTPNPVGIVPSCKDPLF
jgi:hypothetical protein